MAVPKGKVSRQRRDKRRSSHWKLTAPAIVKYTYISRIWQEPGLQQDTYGGNNQDNNR